MLLGLLQWRLLLPEHPVDPTCKHGLKAEVLGARLVQREVELRVHELAQSTWNGATSSADLRQRRAELAHVRAAKEAATERICVRPTSRGHRRCAG